MSRNIASLVSLRGAPPSADTTQTSWNPERDDMNAIDRPSGDHSGSRSSAASAEMRRSPPPEASTVQRSPSRRNATRRPSRDHAGELPSVRTRSSPLAASRSAMCAGPPPAMDIARRAPSGDHVSCRGDRLEKSRFSSVGATFSAPSALPLTIAAAQAAAAIHHVTPRKPTMLPLTERALPPGSRAG
jgi:hypothetical protein